MVCEYLRSCYSTTAVLSPGAEPVPIIWYWADPDAQVLPHPSAITSHNWLDASERSGGTIGEVAGAPRRWRDGSMPNRPPGTDFHGEAAWYVEGVPAGNPQPTIERTASGIPVGCGGPLAAQEGGGAEVAGRGELIAPPPGPFTDCCHSSTQITDQVLAIGSKTGVAVDLPDLMILVPTRSLHQDRLVWTGGEFNEGEVEGTMALSCHVSPFPDNLNTATPAGHFVARNGGPVSCFGFHDSAASCDPVSGTWHMTCYPVGATLTPENVIGSFTMSTGGA